MEFHITKVICNTQGRWGFEVFANEWFLGRFFVYRSEAEATRVAHEFVWLTSRFSIVQPQDHGCLILGDADDDFSKLEDVPSERRRSDSDYIEHARGRG